jgi:CHAT domain-containing protein
LARSFFLAGASRVVASLWDVQDRATADLMHEFYRGLLQRKLSPSAALRGAQLALRSNPQFSHPYYWAGFVVTGDWTP